MVLHLMYNMIVHGMPTQRASFQKAHFTAAVIKTTFTTCKPHHRRTGFEIQPLTVLHGAMMNSLAKTGVAHTLTMMRKGINSLTIA